jgi:hypothetical protein
MNDDERVFSMGEKFFEDLRRALWSRTLPLIVLILLLALLVHPPGVETDPAIIVLGVCILVPMGFIGVRRGFKQLVATYQGFRLFVSPDRLRRVQPGLPDLEIARDEVTRILEVPGKGLTIYGTGRQKFIGIPASLDGFEEVRALLVTWKTPEERRGVLVSWSPILLGLLTVVGFGVVVGSDSRLLVTTLGVVLIGLLLGCIVVLYKSPHADARTRRMIWVLPLIILVVGLRIWTVWHPM